MARELVYLLFLILCGQGIYSQDLGKFTFQATNQPFANNPVEIEFPGLKKEGLNLEIFNPSNGHVYPLQISGGDQAIFIYSDSLEAGRPQNLVLRKSKRVNGISPFRITDTLGGIQMAIGNHPVLFYHVQEAMPPADSPSYYRRSGFIHPVYSPDGKILTDDFPAGHAHQHGLFAAWTNTTFRGESIDFWNQFSKKGTVQHVAVEGYQSGPVFAELRVRLRYLSLVFGEVLEEHWILRLYPFHHFFLFDILGDQENTTNDTLFLNQYHYGGMAFRGNKAWNPDDSVSYQNSWNILTSEGIRDTTANQTHAHWVDASGAINGQQAGVTVFSHPSNFRFPQAIRVHPTMPYWVYAPEQDGSFMIPPGGHFKYRYRYEVHEGKPDITQIRNIQYAWENLPILRWDK